jgi:hypothetical protein
MGPDHESLERASKDLHKGYGVALFTLVEIFRCSSLNDDPAV